VLRAFLEDGTTFRGVTALELLPNRDAFDALLDALPGTALHASLALDDLLVPPSAPARTSAGPYDAAGLSAYARVAGALVHILVGDREAARGAHWALRHTLVLADAARDALALPALSGPVFRAGAPEMLVRETATRAHHVATYLLAGAYEPAWHARVVAACTGGKPQGALDGVGVFVVDLVGKAKERDSVREARVLRTVLEYVLRDGDQADAEQWMVLGRSLEKPGEVTSSCPSIY
jgi:hypothetical protein